jgi:hypothetical protein
MATEPELDLQPSPQYMMMRASELMSGETQTRREVVEIEPGKKVHIWGLEGQKVIILLEQDRKFLGVVKKKGSFDAIYHHYLEKVIPDESVTRH